MKITVHGSTGAGHQLAPVLYEMAMWATDNVPEQAARRPRSRPTPRRLT